MKKNFNERVLSACKKRLFEALFENLRKWGNFYPSDLKNSTPNGGRVRERDQGLP